MLIYTKYLPWVTSFAIPPKCPRPQNLLNQFIQQHLTAFIYPESTKSTYLAFFKSLPTIAEHKTLPNLIPCQSNFLKYCVLLPITIPITKVNSSI